MGISGKLVRVKNKAREALESPSNDMKMDSVLPLHGVRLLLIGNVPNILVYGQ